MQTNELPMNNFVHNIKNQLFIMTMLLRKIKSDQEITGKINTIINDINKKCHQLVDQQIDCLVNFNQAIEEITLIYPDLVFEKHFHENLEFIGKKFELTDVLINMIKNSQEARASKIKFEIEARTLIYTDNGFCTREVIDKLNNSNIFTTKINGCGIGSQVIRQFCLKQGLNLTYSASLYNKNAICIKIEFP